MPSINEMFGFDQEGNPNVVLSNPQNEARQDIVLPICYRNTPWTLSLAHALGFGIYREKGLVQLFNDLDLWDDIGYKTVSGKLQYGQTVAVARKDDSYSSVFLNPVILFTHIYD
jgi:superfamily I DNA and RNA helicase